MRAVVLEVGQHVREVHGRAERGTRDPRPRRREPRVGQRRASRATGRSRSSRGTGTIEKRRRLQGRVVGPRRSAGRARGLPASAIRAPPDARAATSVPIAQPHARRSLTSPRAIGLSVRPTARSRGASIASFESPIDSCPQKTASVRRTSRHGSSPTAIPRTRARIETTRVGPGCVEPQSARPVERRHRGALRSHLPRDPTEPDLHGATVARHIPAPGNASQVHAVAWDWAEGVPDPSARSRSRHVRRHHPHRPHPRSDPRRPRRALEHPHLRRDRADRRGRVRERPRSRTLDPHRCEHAAVATHRRPPWHRGARQDHGDPRRLQLRLGRRRRGADRLRRRDHPRRQADDVGPLRHRPGRRALHRAGARRRPLHAPDGRLRRRRGLRGLRPRRELHPDHDHGRGRPGRLRRRARDPGRARERARARVVRSPSRSSSTRSPTRSAAGRDRSGAGGFAETPGTRHPSPAFRAPAPQLGTASAAGSVLEDGLDLLVLG